MCHTDVAEVPQVVAALSDTYKTGVTRCAASSTGRNIASRNRSMLKGVGRC